MIPSRICYHTKIEKKIKTICNNLFGYEDVKVYDYHEWDESWLNCYYISTSKKL